MTVDCAAGSQRLRKAFFKFLLHGEFLLASILGVSTLPAGTELDDVTGEWLEDPRAVAGCHAKAPYGLDLAAEGSS